MAGDERLEGRIRKADDLRRLGLDVNWRDHSWLEMSDWEGRIRKANDLKRLGIEVDWRTHSWFEMVEMERKARGR